MFKRIRFQPLNLFSRSFATFEAISRPNLRNIGIIAHIDAGKTTTTERFLLLSGITKKIGEVDEGQALMDFLPVEQERGITVNSACTTFNWNKTQINLIDTPGHVDFTFEVERSALVFDSAVLIIDGVKGVQPQTRKVFKQSMKNNASYIAYINKLDRLGSSFDRAVKSLEKEFGKYNVLCLKIQVPIFASQLHKKNLPELALKYFDSAKRSTLADDERLVGVYDFSKAQLHIFNPIQNEKDYISLEKSDLKTMVTQEGLEKIENGKNELLSSMALVDDLTEADLEKDVAVKSILSIIEQGAEADLRVIPILAGSSLKNLGLHPVLDAMETLLPGAKAFNMDINTQNAAIFRVFKITHDRYKGALSFVKVISGSFKIEPNLQVVNLSSENTTLKERVADISKVHANEFSTLKSGLIESGDIIILNGLKNVQTGDFLVTSNVPKSHFKEIQKFMTTLPKLEIPSPVFSASIRPEASDEKTYKEVLKTMTMDDPSLQVTFEKEHRQIILAGMGELHLDVIERKLKEETGINLSMDEIKVNFREVLVEPITFETDIPVALLLLKKIEEEDPFVGSDSIQLSFSFVPKTVDDDISFRVVGTKRVQQSLLLQIEETIKKISKKGPISASPIFGMECILNIDNCNWAESTKGQMLSLAINTYFKRLFKQFHTTKKSSFALYEPFGVIRIEVPAVYHNDVLTNISSSMRGAEILNVDTEFENYIISANVTMASTMKYTSKLRSLSKGEGTFTVEYDKYSLSL